MKKLVSMVCTLALLASVCIPAFAAAAENGNSQIISALEQGFRVGKNTYTLPSDTITDATRYLEGHPVPVSNADEVVDLISAAREFVREKFILNPNPNLVNFTEKATLLNEYLQAGANAAYDTNAPTITREGTNIIITEKDDSRPRTEIAIPTLVRTHDDDDDDDDDDDEDPSTTPSKPVTPPTTPNQTFVSDTTSDFAVKGSYQFKITSKDGKAPVFVIGTPGVFEIASVTHSGSDYFFKLRAIGAPGEQAGIYINNGPRLVVVTVGSNPDYAKLDTGRDLTVRAGKTYQFKITASKKPTFVSGTGSVFRVSYAGSKGNDYFFKVTATGKAGDKAGFYVNGEKAPRTIGTVA